MSKIGFIGCGNMGGALALAVAKELGGSSVLLCDADRSKASVLADRLSASVTSLEVLVSDADVIFLGVKPQGFEGLLAEIAPRLRERGEAPLLVSMAAGLSIAKISAMLGVPARIIRIMPNTPVAVGEGMILYSTADTVTDSDLALFLSAMKQAGRVTPIPEDKIDAASAVSGCGPAFAYLFAEALADAGVSCGLARADAQMLAAQMMLGSAKMVLESDRNPGALKDAVCSPGGTTIAGVYALEQGGFRASVMSAVMASYRRTLELK